MYDQGVQEVERQPWHAACGVCVMGTSPEVGAVDVRFPGSGTSSDTLRKPGHLAAGTLSPLRDHVAHDLH